MAGLKVTSKRILLFLLIIFLFELAYLTILPTSPWMEIRTLNVESSHKSKEQKKAWIDVAIKRNFLKEVVSTSVPDSRLEKNTLTLRGDEIQFDHFYCKSVAVSQSEQHEGCPSLFIIGTRKGGTTSLINYLSKHPDFRAANPGGGLRSGETFFFNRINDTSNTSTWRKYLSKFPNDAYASLSGESTVSYSTNCLVPNRIQRACGSKAKIVYLLRNPYRRFESHYLMRAGTSKKAKSDINAMFEAEWKKLLAALGNRYNFNQQIDHMSQTLELNCAVSGIIPNLLYEGLYSVFLANWLCVWPAENILIINSEEFFKAPGKIVNQVLLFLGLDKLSDETLSAVTSTVYNKGIQSKNISMNSRNRMLIQNLYEPFNKNLLDLLQWSSVDWNY